MIILMNTDDVDDDIYLPVRRISILVTADYYDDDSRNYLIVHTDQSTIKIYVKVIFTMHYHACQLN